MTPDPVQRIRFHDRARARLVCALLALALLALALLLVILGFTAVERVRVREALRTIVPGVEGDGDVYVRMTAGFVAAGLLAAGAFAVWRGLSAAPGGLGVVLILPPVFLALSAFLALPKPVAWLSMPLRVGAGSASIAIWGTWAVTLAVYLHTLALGGFSASHDKVTEVFE